MLAWAMVVAGAVLVVVLRGLGLDMTEGQALLAYLPWWLLAVGLLIGGVAIGWNLE
ncbi:hypothetical protein DPPLL_30840 [Desulfofustis limnaeus]|uniref:Uncharacterized protein n=1 Tax=Desulfofustis limnaeus TaxID=2740163 RepID=A0ABM7WCP5_9BACT|nr:hypothetical protein DPPLL_30840 [Desulfofustis limnaeus]